MIGSDLLNKGLDSEFITNVLLPRIKAFDIKQYGYDNPALESQTAVRIASTVTSSKEIADVFSLFPLAQKYQGAMQSGLMLDSFKIFADNDPTLKVKAFDAAWNGLLVSLGQGPAMDLATKFLGDLQGGLNALSNWSDKHKDLSATLVEVAAALGVLSTAAAAAAGLAFVGGPMVKVARYGAGLAAGEALAGSAIPGAAIAGGALSTLFGPLGIATFAGAAGAWNLNPFGLNDVAWNPLHPFTLDHRRADGTWDSERSAAPTEGTPPAINLSGTVNMDGKKVGTFVAGSMAGQGELPSAGPTGMDIRIPTPQPGFVPPYP